MAFTDMFTWGLTWWDEQLTTHASADIRYEQAGMIYDLKATHGASENTVDDLTVLLQSNSVDWVISRKLNTNLPADFKPKRGDKIHALVGDQMVAFEVMSDGNEPPFRRSDTYGNRIRIHSKRVDLSSETLPGGGQAVLGD